MKHKKISLMAEKISQVFRNSTKKINYLFLMVENYEFVNLALQPRFFAKKMT
jgi:nicotinamide riboside transporter PnuC